MSSGHARKKNGRWYARYELPSGPDGERKRREQGSWRTRKEAEQALREILSSMDTGSYVAPDERTVSGYLMDEWLPSIRDSVRPSTHADYRHKIATYVLPSIGHVRLQQLAAPQLNSLYADLRDHGRKRGKGGLSAKTVRNVHTTIRKAFGDAERWGFVQRNVAALAEPPKVKAGDRPEMRTWTADQLRQFLTSDAVGTDRLRAAWHLASSTGMRRGEVLGLRWSDVDLDASELSVRQTWISVAGRPAFSTPKTAHGRRRIALDIMTVSELRTWRKTQLAERMRWGPAYEDLDLVFARENGSAIHPDVFSQRFETLRAEVGVPRIRLHDLRHTHASIALQANVHPKVVSERLGHSTVSFTLDVYSHVIPAMQADAAESISRLVMGE